MKKFISGLVFGFAVLLLAPTAQACSCANLTFMPTAKRSDSVIRAKVLEYRWDQPDRKQMPVAMIVEVKEVYKGTIKSRQVKVLGDNGITCRPFVVKFPIGTEWVFAVSEISYGVGKKELALSNCAESLAVKGDRATGNVNGVGANPKPQVVRLSDLRKLLKAGV